MRLIDADNLIKRATDSSGSCWDTTCQGTGDFVDYVNDEPTACDIDAIKAELKSLYDGQRTQHTRTVLDYVFEVIDSHTK